VRSADLGELPSGGEARFDVVEELPAGAVPARTVGPGQAAFIMTGAPVPTGADFVVPVEYSRREGGKVILAAYSGGANVRSAGEVSRRGEPVLSRGTGLGPAELALLTSVGLARVMVRRRPRVAVLSTGDELLGPGEAAEPGKIWACNAPALCSLVRAYGGSAVDLGIVPDNEKGIEAAFRRALDASDAVVSSGGVSVGRWDHVRGVIARLCPDARAWQVRMRPGRPQVFGTHDGVLIFGLPGNPVAVMVSFYQFVRAALLKMQGRSRPDIPEVTAVLDEPVKKKPGVLHFLRAVLSFRDGAFHARTTGAQGSGIVSSMATANALLCVGPERTRYDAGETLTAQILDFKPFLPA
jgi:molybdopterin molybdotransferase